MLNFLYFGKFSSFFIYNQRFLFFKSNISCKDQPYHFPITHPLSLHTLFLKGLSFQKPNKGRCHLWIIKETVGTAPLAVSTAHKTRAHSKQQYALHPCRKNAVPPIRTSSPLHLLWHTPPCRPLSRSTIRPRRSRAARSLSSWINPLRANANGGKYERSKNTLKRDPYPRFYSA